jgi:hypothetical protein
MMLSKEYEQNSAELELLLSCTRRGAAPACAYPSMELVSLELRAKINGSIHAGPERKFVLLETSSSRYQQFRSRSSSHTTV